MAKLDCACTRRGMLKTLGLGAGLPLFLQETNLAFAANTEAGVRLKHPERILVVLELTGGNDGLNTIVPYSNDEYYKLRPRIGVPKQQVIKLSDDFGLHPNLGGFERIFKDGRLAVAHGCSYPNPDRSHFVSMRYWHTADPNGPESSGWVGRFADAAWTQPKNGLVVNVAKEQTLAVSGVVQSPITFDDPKRFVRDGSSGEKEVFAEVFKKADAKSGNPSLDFVRSIATTAAESSDFIRNACAEFRTKMDYGYGEVGTDLKKVTALIKAGYATRIYYVKFGSFDTHAAQGPAHNGLFDRLGDAVYGFLNDVKALGQANNVAVMMFTEFGRRVAENASLGTDHGVASPMFMAGATVKGGFYGKHPSLTDLDQGDLKMTTDFRSVYATMMKEWMGFDDTKAVLRGTYPTLGVFV
jgi:uncharacterized protein (DUF1501 family)